MAPSRREPKFFTPSAEALEAAARAAQPEDAGRVKRPRFRIPGEKVEQAEKEKKVAEVVQLQEDNGKQTEEEKAKHAPAVQEDMQAIDEAKDTAVVGDKAEDPIMMPAAGTPPCRSRSGSEAAQKTPCTPCATPSSVHAAVDSNTPCTPAAALRQLPATPPPCLAAALEAEAGIGSRDSSSICIGRPCDSTSGDGEHGGSSSSTSNTRNFILGSPPSTPAAPTLRWAVHGDEINPTPEKTSLDTLSASKAGVRIAEESDCTIRKACKTSSTQSPSAASLASVEGAKTAAETATETGRSKLPLQDVVVVFTGGLSNVITLEDAEDRIRAAGGKVGAAVSGNTTWLVVGGQLEDGRSAETSAKYRRYLDLKEKGKKFPELLDEVQFMDRLPKVHQPDPCNAAVSAVVSAAVAPSKPSQVSHAVQYAAQKAEPPATPKALPFSNWVDTHAPRKLDELIGQNAVVRKLSEWLQDWESVVLKGQTKKFQFRAGGGAPENLNARAALVSGPPGIGKTTTCRLVAQLHGGYEVLEYNASDARGQKVIQEMADGIADNTTISFKSSAAGKGSVKAGLTRRAVIIMDEVDGMGSGDRGGNAALMKMIKKTRNPIICICNDQHSQKVRSLASVCLDLKFTRPSKCVVAQRCADIARREGLDVEPNALEALAESCGGDMRMVLNQLQMLSRSSEVTYMDMKSRMGQFAKDQEVMMGPFDACKKLLNSAEASKLSFKERTEMFFVDYSLVGLLVHENYLRSVERRPVNAQNLNICAISANLMALGDILSEKIHGHQEWGLLPDMAVVSSTYPAFATNGFLAFPTFPAALGKFSTLSRTKRLAMELQAHLRLSGTVSRKALMTSGYADLLYRRLVDPLRKGDTASIAETVGLLDAYGLRKDHLVEHLTELRNHLGQEDLFKMVDPKVKAAMTRELNNGGHAMKVLLPSGGKRKRAEGFDDHEGAEEDGEDNRQEEEPARASGDEDEGGTSCLVKVKAKATAKSKGKAKTAAPEVVEGDPERKAKARKRSKA